MNLYKRLVFLLLIPFTLFSQERGTELRTFDNEAYTPYLFLGYYGNVTGSLPVGVGSGMFFNNWGIFINAKFGGDAISEYDVYDYSETEEFGDEDMGNAEYKWGVETGIFLRVTGALFVYGGGGYYSADKYRKWYDPLHILGSGGIYYTDDGAETTLSLVGGIIYFTPYYFYLQAGFDTYPGGLNLGIGFYL